MRMWLLSMAILALGCFAAPVVVEAEEGGFNWNPFARKEKPANPRGRVADEPSEDGWSLPKLKMPQLPQWKAPSMSARSETARRAQQQNRGPSTWEKMNRSTASFFSKTKETLMPWTADQPEKPPTRMRMASRRTKQPKSSFFSLPSIFPKKEPTKPPGSVQEFLSQPRP